MSDEYEVGTLEDAEKFAIIRMAKEAGFTDYYPERLIRFTSLVATHVLEMNKVANAVAIETAVAVENEACAKVCEERDDAYGTFTVRECAAAIRARRNK